MARINQATTDILFHVLGLKSLISFNPEPCCLGDDGVPQFARYPSLAGKAVLITGGAAGIGRSLVEAFVEQGARVAFLDIDENSGNELVRHLKCSGASDVKSTPLPPVRHYTNQMLKAAIATAEDALGSIRVLVNNAANDSRHTFEDLTSETFDKCMAINLKHHLFASQAVAPGMAASGGGSIVCVGSIAWLNNTTAMIGYTTAKAGIHGLVRTLARQLGPRSIRVNALLPGWTMTERQLRLWVDSDAEREISRAQCLPGRVMPDDVARITFFSERITPRCAHNSRLSWTEAGYEPLPESCSPRRHRADTGARAGQRSPIVRERRGAA